MNKLISSFAEQNNIIAGICDAKRLNIPYAERLLDAPFITGNLSLRLDPKLNFAAATSVIVIGVGHNWICKQPGNLKEHGRIARYAIGKDYHTVVFEILENLADEMKKYIDFSYKILVDKNPLCERELAVKAGLGYIAKNRAVISEKFGSYFNIGVMLTDLELKPNSPTYKKCPEDCFECIKSCPGNALTHEGFDYKKCVSYLSQKKGELSESQKSSMLTWVYGCDLCQEACPKNKVVAAYTTDTENLYPYLDELINMDEIAYKQRFENSALYWRGRETLIRNSVCAKRNVLNGILELKRT